VAEDAADGGASGVEHRAVRGEREDGSGGVAVNDVRRGRGRSALRASSSVLSEESPLSALRLNTPTDENALAGRPNLFGGWVRGVPQRVGTS